MPVICKNYDYIPTITYKNDSASLQQCCLDASDDVQTNCMPGYCPGSTMCENYMKDNCTTRFTNDINCKAWCTANHGQCDAGAMDFCKTRAIASDRGFCSCINSPVVKSLPPMEPTCFDGNCIAWGYKTSAQVEAGLDCPDESLPPPYSPADPKAAAELAAANAAASAANAAAASAANAAAASAADASFDSASATAVADVNAEVLWQKNIQILIWVVSFLFIIGTVAYVLNQMKKKQRQGRAPTRSPKQLGTVHAER